VKLKNVNYKLPEVMKFPYRDESRASEYSGYGNLSKRAMRLKQKFHNHHQAVPPVKCKLPKFDAEWREPKWFIIYTVNENGEKTKDSEVWIDGTFQRPDHTAQLLAMWLFYLGVSGASSVTFVADDAVWIWEQFSWLVQELSLHMENVFLF
jgi:hypothetical protein